MKCSLPRRFNCFENCESLILTSHVHSSVWQKDRRLDEGRHEGQGAMNISRFPENAYLSFLTVMPSALLFITLVVTLTTRTLLDDALASRVHLITSAPITAKGSTAPARRVF